MLKQYIQGLNPKTLSFSDNSDEDSLLPLLAGKIEKYEQTATGGAVLNELPATLNRKEFIVSKDSPTGRISSIVRIPHVKETFYFNELNASVKGKFDSSFTSDVKCDEVKLRFDSLVK
ncbi:hypothetical protein CPIN17262_0485 [Campylobacter pinnipediorum subsp. pinnipediorum]|uniref:hypothetical protein n=1 Tax=Campylobacter pinnipediorum TaxID=1965231 RepID=UPI0009958B75|nr:hypothetical protein [Campylobacter pinnipediorum]AQW84186.1 hypothetical protein CPIN17262_0485 [Campylobacter pinnipediorum subsp. pinnipediorum]